MEKEKSNEGKNEHHHPPYVFIYVVLVVLTALSIVVSWVVHKESAPPYVFTISTIKSLLIALFYMHLKYEGRWVLSLAIIPLIIFAIVLFALMPDILVTIKM